MDRIMSIDLERPNLRKRIGGYDVRAVDTLLRGAARTLHELRMENETLREKLSAQYEELERARGQERAVTDILAQAQRAADETRAAAHRQADALIEEARLAAIQERLDSQKQVSEASYELERLRDERVRAERDLRMLLERMLRDLDGRSPSKQAVIEVDSSSPPLEIVAGEGMVAGI